MAFTDKDLACQDCGITFVFSASEQEFFAERNYENEPKRCPQCRSFRRSGQGGGGSGGSRGGSSPYYTAERQFFTTTCASCGGEARVPFQPRNNKPVYCSACFSKIGSER